MSGERVVRRSELTIPAHSLKMMTSGSKSEADLVMLDLEDACAVSQKVGARKTLAEAANTLDWSGKTLAFRPNNIRSKFFLDDMLEVLGEAGRKIQVVILPKTEQPDEVKYVSTLLGHLEQKFSLPVGKIKLEVLIESCHGVLHAEEIARATPRMAGLIFGVADYAADVGAALGSDTFTDFVYAKQKTITAAHAAGIDAVDCVTLRFKDLDQVKKDAELGRRMGFDGKWCIHPSHVPVVNAAFSPTPDQIDRALKIIDAYQKADVEAGLGAIVIGEEMADQATIRVEEKVLSVARKAGLLK